MAAPDAGGDLPADLFGLVARFFPLAPDPRDRVAWWAWVLQQTGDQDGIPRPLDDRLMDNGFGDAAQAFLIYVDDLRSDEPELEIGPPRPFNVRQPYTVTTAIRRTDWFERSFEFDEKWFRVAYRMSKATFFVIVRLLERDPIFQSTGRRPQRSVKYQLGIFLLRFGLLGSPTTDPALKTGVGHGTVTLYCRRVTRALRQIGTEVVAWPNDARKDEIKLALGHRFGIDGAIGIVDGSLIPLTQKPAIAGDTYLSRNKTVAINAQVVVDHQCRIIAYELGWPGSKNDRFIWLNSYIWLHHSQFFGPGEFLLGDKGYPCSHVLLRPYAEDELGDDRRRRRDFNKRLSRTRVIVERAFGRLKSRFPCLGLMGTPEDIRDLYRSIEALMVLHNLCIDYHDTVDGRPDDYVQRWLNRANQADDLEGDWREHVGYEDPANIDDEVFADENEDVLLAGRMFRDCCVDILFPRD